MELDDYIKSLFRHRWLIIIVVIISVLGAYFYAFSRPITYDASVSITIKRVNNPETSEFQYDEFYAIQASDLVSQTVVSWLATPSVVTEIYQRADLDPAIKSLNDITRRFTTRKLSSQNIVVKVNEESEEVARKLAAAITEDISTRVAQLVTTTDDQASFEAQASKSVVVENRIDSVLYGIIGLIAGFFIGLFLAAAIEGVKRGSRQD
ncbi:MAG: Wzz/FepE/Etk N-terminal domain-containing protein [bacterium]